MSMQSPIAKLSQLGQSPWLDFIQRSLLDSGELQRLIDQDQVRGLTSNPAIFEQAIAKTDEYDQALAEAAKTTKDSYALYEQLAIADISRAADIFLPTYQATQGHDGFVSIEVSPELAHDEEATVKDALSLNSRFAQPNVMIKVPGTEAGLGALRRLTEEGVSVNVTLLFSVERYKAVAEAYIAGLEARHAKGLPIDRISSVASFFVSRVDNTIDPQLEANGSEQALALKGKMAIANAKAAYQAYLERFESPRFAALANAGAKAQRLLWASTGVKNPDYPPTLYIDTLIGNNTVNTVPPKTLDAYRELGRPSLTLEPNTDEALADLIALDLLGISIEEAAESLEQEGIAGFKVAFSRLLSVIDDKVASMNR